MGAKTAIRDVGRALDLPLTEVNRIAKFIPERPGITFDKALSPEENPEHWQDLKNAFESPDPRVQQMLAYARSLEGTARHTGIHASAIIIAPGKLSDYVPLAVAKNKNSDKGEVIITQYDGPHAEQAGLLKMDFLGLKTLTIIKTALRLIAQNYGERPGIPRTPDDIRIEEPPASDDPDVQIWNTQHWKTYELYQQGETVATFQFESEGMRKYLRQLKPTNIEDLIAMNALYRPGPMDNIPSFIARKHGHEVIEYAHPLLEPILRNTYGIMVYQEQIMQCAQVLAGYSLGGADLLRRAMGKKKKEVMEKERSKFVEGCALHHQIPAEQAGLIFDTMEKFAAYGFNKSHSAAYSVLAFRTAYLKANFPAEYMAAVLSHNLDHIDKITLFMEECRRMGLSVLPPCVNESDYGFSVNQKQQIRFGLGAIKGLGESSARAIIAERVRNGPFQTIFELTSRIDPRMMNKKTLEALTYAGALDALTDRSGKPVDRARYLAPLPSDPELTVLEQALRYGQRLHEERNSPQVSLFGEMTGTTSIPEPEIPWCEPAPSILRLNQEREVIGFFLSGHPLDAHRAAIDRFATCSLADLDQFRDRDIAIAGIVTAVQERATRTGARFMLFTLEDFSGAVEIALFNDDYTKYAAAVAPDACLFIEARYEPNYRNPDQYEVRRLRAVRFLDTLISERTKELVIQCRLDQVNAQLIENINRLLLNHSGPCKVSFVIEDLAQQYVQKFKAAGIQVAPHTDLLAELNQLNLSYALK
jgi:DNA polymerase-3 subunit alpha